MCSCFPGLRQSSESLAQHVMHKTCLKQLSHGWQLEHTCSREQLYSNAHLHISNLCLVQHHAHH